MPGSHMGCKGRAKTCWRLLRGCGCGSGRISETVCLEVAGRLAALVYGLYAQALCPAGPKLSALTLLKQCRQRGLVLEDSGGCSWPTMSQCRARLCTAGLASLNAPSYPTRYSCQDRAHGFWVQRTEAGRALCRTACACAPPRRTASAPRPPWRSPGCWAPPPSACCPAPCWAQWPAGSLLWPSAQPQHHLSCGLPQGT